jgi:hypothetical protein
VRLFPGRDSQGQDPQEAHTWHLLRKPETSDTGQVLCKRIQVPDSWLRGFLQVQSAPTLPRTSFELSPIDIYNLLRHLRLNADQKRKGRGLRVTRSTTARQTACLSPPGYAPIASRSSSSTSAWLSDC